MKNTNDKLILTTFHGHTAGFFSNCSVRLDQIVNFFNLENVLPESIDSSQQFKNYKENINDRREDLSKYFFDHVYVNESFSKTNFNRSFQYRKYKDFNFRTIIPYIEKFFSPSSIIKTIIDTLEKKYLINYENICAVYYRGNDKANETALGSYEVFFEKAQDVLRENPNIQFLVQTDELEFAQTFMQKFPNSISFEELVPINHNSKSSVHHTLIRSERKQHASYFLAAIIIISKAKHLITYSGNCGLWAVLYRGNGENVHQYLMRRRRNQITGEITMGVGGWI